MPASSRRTAGNGPRPNLFLALAGVQAGTVAGLLLLGYLALDSKWHGRSIWTIPNLFASTFYGEAAYRPGYGAHTTAGLALLLPERVHRQHRAHVMDREITERVDGLVA